MPVSGYGVQLLSLTRVHTGIITYMPYKSTVATSELYQSTPPAIQNDISVSSISYW